MSKIPGYLGTTGLAARYGISSEHARRLIQIMPGAFKLGRTWVIKESDVPVKPPSLTEYQRRQT